MRDVEFIKAEVGNNNNHPSCSSRLLNKVSKWRKLRGIGVVLELNSIPWMHLEWCSPGELNKCVFNLLPSPSQRPIHGIPICLRPVLLLLISLCNNKPIQDGDHNHNNTTTTYCHLLCLFQFTGSRVDITYYSPFPVLSLLQQSLLHCGNRNRIYYTYLKVAQATICVEAPLEWGHLHCRLRPPYIYNTCRQTLELSSAATGDVGGCAN